MNRRCPCMPWYPSESTASSCSIRLATKRVPRRFGRSWGASRRGHRDEGVAWHHGLAWFLPGPLARGPAGNAKVRETLYFTCPTFATHYRIEGYR